MTGFEVDVAVARDSVAGVPFHLEAAFRAGGGITALFGPSGSGKSTLLLTILGAIRPDRGKIGVCGRVLFDHEADLDVPIPSRRVGIVFQDALLFPHLNALHNVAFGLRGAARGERALQMLRRVGSEALARRMPTQLSGGERQRVALARALAGRPDALLLDEPFSALDAVSREAMGALLLELQPELSVPFLHVTHDLGEALRLATEMVVLDGGRVVQTGIPAAVAANPLPEAAVRAIGSENVFSGEVLGDFPTEGYARVDLGGTVVETGLLGKAPGSKVVLGLRAEDVLLAVAPVVGISARNVLAGTVLDLCPRGTAIEVRVATPASFRVAVTRAAIQDLHLEPGRRVYLLAKATAFRRLG